MKSNLFLFFLLILPVSLLSQKKETKSETYRLTFEGIACHFEVTINDKIVFTNRYKYHVQKSIFVDKFLDNEKKQVIQYTMFKLPNRNALTSKSSFSLKLEKVSLLASDTIAYSRSPALNAPDGRGGEIYPMVFSWRHPFEK